MVVIIRAQLLRHPVLARSLRLEPTSVNIQIRALGRSAKTKTVVLDEVACQNTKGARLVAIMGGLTTHSTGAELACLSSRTWMLFADSSRPVNSGVRPLRMNKRIKPWVAKLRKQMQR